MSEELDELKKLIHLMEEHDVSELEIENENRRIHLRRGGGRVEAPPPPQPAALPPTEAPKAEAEEESGLIEIRSPMVGTFYRAPAPDADPYVEVGDRVTPETVLCIIEAMKVMNEIKAETAGEVAKILVKNQEPVEFNQLLFLIRPV